MGVGGRKVYKWERVAGRRFWTGKVGVVRWDLYKYYGWVGWHGWLGGMENAAWRGWVCITGMQDGNGEDGSIVFLN